LPIEGYNGSEILITSTSGNLTPPEKAKGLKPIYPSGSDNTGIGLDVQKIDNLITITCLIPFTQDGEYKIKVLKICLLSYQADAKEITISQLRI